MDSAAATSRRLRSVSKCVAPDRRSCAGWALNAALSQMNAPPVIPPFRFATVEAGRGVAKRSAEACGAESLYRSAHPSLRNYRFLLGLNLQTIISLVPSSEPVKDLAEFCEMNLITHRHFQVPRFRGLHKLLTYATPPFHKGYTTITSCRPCVQMK